MITNPIKMLGIAFSIMSWPLLLLGIMANQNHNKALFLAATIPGIIWFLIGASFLLTKIQNNEHRPN